MPRTLFRRANPTRRNGMPDWRSNGFPAGFTVVTTQIGRNPHSLDLYMQFTEDAIRPTRVTVRARKTSDGSEEHAQYDAVIARWVITPASPSIQGSIIGLNPGETWDVRWRIAFDDGDVRDYLWTSLTTPSERTYAAPGTLTPTRYVKTAANGGSDAADGLTYATAWATWQKMVSTAPSGAIVEVDDGRYESTSDAGSGTNERNSSITVIPRNPWIGDDGADLANGHRVFVEPPNRTAPGSSWTLVTGLTGPGRFGNAVTTYSLWKWTSTITDATFLTGTYRATEFGDPDRLHHHYRDADYLSTPGGFAEYIYTNRRYRFGFWVDSTGDIYCRIPTGASDDGGTGADPNTLYLTFASITQCGISLKNGVGSRVNGIGFVGFGRGVHAAAADATVDHCFFGPNFLPIRFQSSDQHLAHSRIIDTNCAADPVTFKTADWGAVKLAGTMADGTAYGSKICGASEGQLHLSNSARPTIRNNYIRGMFNGCGSSGAANTTQRFNGWGANIYNNTFTLISDDCIEPEQEVMLWKVWNNRFEKSISGVSTGPLHGGPIYFFKNQVWQNGGAYIGRTVAGAASASGKVFSKFSSESEPQTTIYAVHNTFVSVVLNPDGLGTIFAGDSAGGTTSSGTKVHEKHHWYGNVIYVAYRIMDEINEQNDTEWYDDYNYYVTRDDVTPSGIKVGGTHYTNATASLDMGDYRANEHQGTHSNLVGTTTHELNGSAAETWMEAQIPGFATGTLALAVASDLLDIVPPCPITARLGQPFYNAGYQPL